MGLMNQSEKERFLEHLRSHYRGCPACHGQGANAVEVVSLPVLERVLPDGIGPGPQLVPVIPVVCSQCGHVALFKAADFISVR